MTPAVGRERRSEEGGTIPLGRERYMQRSTVCCVSNFRPHSHLRARSEANTCLPLLSHVVPSTARGPITALLSLRVPLPRFHHFKWPSTSPTNSKVAKPG